jgi:hypothetical protein
MKRCNAKQTRRGQRFCVVACCSARPDTAPRQSTRSSAVIIVPIVMLPRDDTAEPQSAVNPVCTPPHRIANLFFIEGHDTRSNSIQNSPFCTQAGSCNFAPPTRYPIEQLGSTLYRQSAELKSPPGGRRRLGHFLFCTGLRRREILVSTAT